MSKYQPLETRSGLVFILYQSVQIASLDQFTGRHYTIIDFNEVNVDLSTTESDIHRDHKAASCHTKGCDSLS